MIKRLTMLLVAMVAVAAIAAGCGDDDEAEGVTTSSLSKAAYLKEANKVCIEGKEKTSEKVLPLLSADPAKQKSLQAEITKIAAQNTQVQHDGIRELGAPEGSEDQVEAILAAMQLGLDEAQEKNIESSEKFVKEFEQFDELAREYGLTSCTFSSN